MLPTPNNPTEEWAKMRYACVTGDAEMMKEVLATPNVDVNEKTGYGETVLFQACYDGEYEAAKLLIEANANVNIITGEKHTCLMQAAYWGPDHGHKDDAIKIVKMLLDAGADPMVVDKGDNTAAEFARRRGDVPEIVAMLEKAEKAAASG